MGRGEVRGAGWGGDAFAAGLAETAAAGRRSGGETAASTGLLGSVA